MAKFKGASFETLAKMAEARSEAVESEFYRLRSLLGNANWAMFYIILGAREAGKSYAIMEYFVKCWKEKGIPFTWLRLNEASVKKMLANKAEKFVDPDIARKYGLDLKTSGGTVYDDGKPMAKILALSTFANDKGVALFDNEFLDDPSMAYHICLDEFQLEKTQRRQGDIAYQFVQQMENLVRSKKDRLKIFLVGNTLEEASDILTKFNFIPEEFGRYYIKSKRAVVDYIKPSKAYLERRKGTVGDILSSSESNFTNEINFDRSLITKVRLIKPTATIHFDKTTKFTLWDDGIIAKYNGETTNTNIAMRPYQDVLFNPNLRDNVITLFDNRNFYYRNLITQKQFQNEIRLLKPRGV